MSIIREESLFGIHELLEMEPIQRYDTIIEAIDLNAIFHEVNKTSRRGAPFELNYAAMIISLFVHPDECHDEQASCIAG